MIRKVQYVLYMALLTCMMQVQAYGEEISTLPEAVNMAGKQRMYTQRMLKDYAMVGMENHFGNPEEDLKKTMADFEAHLDALIAFNQDPKTEESLQKVKEMWVPIKETLSQAPDIKKAGKLQEDLDALLKQSNDAVDLFVKQSGKVSGETINIAGRQRMLSQRMASLYMLKVWGVNDPKFKEKMDTTMKLFRESLDKLEKSEMNTPEITALLKKVERSFKFFEVMNRSKSKFIPALIYRKSNDILKDMNTATGLYAVQKN